MIRLAPATKPFIVLALPHGMSFSVRPRMVACIVGLDGEPLESDMLRRIVAEHASMFINAGVAGPGWRN